MDNIREKLVELIGSLTTVQVFCDMDGDPVSRLVSRVVDEEDVDGLADHLIANGVTIQEWIPVTEPPKEWRRDNGEMINYLVYVPEFGVDIGNYGEPAKCWLCMGLPCKPTHWAHLPTPPKKESERGG